MLSDFKDDSQNTIYEVEDLDSRGKLLFSKDDPRNTIYRVDDLDSRGPLLFSFDKIHILNLWTDYPYKFTDEQKKIFDKEYPYWADFFKDRK